MKISRGEFVETLQKSGFKSGTEFKVFKGTEEIGVVAVVRSTIVYVDVKEIPKDLFINDEYSFEMLEVE